MKLFVVLTIALSSFFLLTENVFAAGSGGHALALGLSSISSNQSDLNNITSTINSTQGGVTTGSMGSAYDFFLQYQYRFSGMFAMILRPSYFSASASGSGATVGTYSHNLTGYTVFPMARLIPLENKFIKFFMQVGIGYGSLTGKVVQGTTRDMTYGGSAFGAMGGLGAEFCFTPMHCMALEGNLRYLPIARNMATAVNGTFTSGTTGFSQATVGSEVEYNNSDLSTTMSGVQGAISYVMNF